MKKFFVMMGAISLLSLGIGTASADVTGISVGSQNGTITAGTGGTATYTISFSKTTGGPSSSASGFSVTGLPAGASYTVSPSSVSASGGNPMPTVTLTVTASSSIQAGNSTFTFSSTNPSLSATGQLAVGAFIEPCNGSTFDSFSTGSVDGQGQWYVSGPFDQEIVPNTFGIPSFGCKSLRISNATTSQLILNQVFSSPANAEAGEMQALDSNGSTGTASRPNRFEAQFDLASVTGNEQPGMHLSVSPDRGDGTRMSSLGFVDTASGIDMYFDDVTGTTSPVSFNETKIDTLDRLSSHTIKYVMDFVEGPSNDVVKIYVDGTLVHTGTSWENFYRYDSQAFPAPNATTSRTVSHLVFYEQAPATPANQYAGYLVDNVSLVATTTPINTTTPPTITLNGSSTMSVIQGDTFTDPGATAVDSTGGSLVVTATGTVDTAVIGSYSIVYSATDSNSNTASSTRTVDVVASSTATTTPPSSTSTLPIITLNGSSTMNLFVGDTFSDPGATAVSGTTSLQVTATGTVNTAASGTYMIMYSATDSNQNTATTSRTVNVSPATSTSTPVVSQGGGGVLSLPSGGGGYFVFTPQGNTNGGEVTVNQPTGTSSVIISTITPPAGQVLGATIYAFSRNLKFGSVGDDVQELQKYLVSQGYLVISVPTRYFGRMTHAALVKWQHDHDLPATGFFGPMTRGVIMK